MRGWAVLFLVLGGTVGAAGAAAPTPDDRDFFEKRVRPLLAQRCWGCHSAKSKKSRGGLRLDSHQAILEGGDSGAAVVPGQPERSLLVQAVQHRHATVHMPPSGQLPPREVAVLVEWVRRGAHFPGPETAPARAGIDLAASRKFWSFQPLRAHAP